MDSTVDKKVGGEILQIILSLIEKTENSNIVWQRNQDNEPTTLIKPCISNSKEKSFTCEHNGLQIRIDLIQKSLLIKGAGKELIYKPGWYGYWVGNPLVPYGHYEEPSTSFDKLIVAVKMKMDENSYEYNVNAFKNLLS